MEMYEIFILCDVFLIAVLPWLRLLL
jgi:hypothetical protein